MQKLNPNSELLALKREKFKDAFTTIAEIIFDSLYSKPEKIDNKSNSSSNLDTNNAKKLESAEDKKLLTVNDLAEYFKTSRESIYQMVHTKKIPYIKVGRTLRFKESAIKTFVDNNTHNSDNDKAEIKTYKNKDEGKKRFI